MTKYIIISSQIESIEGKLLQPLEIATNRVNGGYWPFYQSTSNRKWMLPGDQALMYLSGSNKNAQKFLGWFTVDSIQKDIKKSPFYENSLVASKPTDLLLMSRFEFFTPLLDIKPLIGHLEFIQDVNKWGKYLQGGCRKISDADFNRIVEDSRIASGKSN